MHIPDGFLDPKLSTGLVGVAIGAVGYCLTKVINLLTALIPQQVFAPAGNVSGEFAGKMRRVITDIGEKKINQMLIVAMWIFAAQMFNFPINNGTSGHLIGGVFASVILGPYAGTVVVSVVLVVQAVFFSDGGIIAMGANIINMAIIGSFLSYYIYIAFKKIIPYFISIMIALWFSVMLAAFACSLEIYFSGVVGFKEVLTSMLKVHSIIGLFEGIITLALIKLFNKMEG